MCRRTVDLQIIFDAHGLAGDVVNPHRELTPAWLRDDEPGYALAVELPLPQLFVRFVAQLPELLQPVKKHLAGIDAVVFLRLADVSRVRLSR